MANIRDLLQESADALEAQDTNGIYSKKITTARAMLEHLDTKSNDGAMEYEVAHFILEELENALEEV